ncbi:protein translocase subunit SecD [Caulobacter segnis]|uniref:Protein translocase subunit SecD n=2 Tax=Caulobacter segnis TaxID=88688 RepID=D5VIW0_CAUST|nr:protein translocase subunit SecD [Caulobacter segnis]ADG09926.1 protein-export membrane protein SecD [Caulobacter segnis ATCC 21756]AVQ01682.1 protein translocase subunit SecD [Caulobacter segnis]
MLTLSRWKIIAVTLSVVFGILFSLPNVLPQKTLDAMPAWLPHQKLNLGLDLQGGSYLLYEVDTEALHRERLSNLMEDTRTQLRSEQIPFGELNQQGEIISVRIGDPARYNDALNLLRKNLGAPLAGAIGGKDVSVSGKGDNRIEVRFVPEAIKADAVKAVDQSIETIRRRIDSLGTKEPSINRQGENRIMIQAPGESDPEKLRAIIGKTAKLTFQMVDETVTPEDMQAGRIPPGSEVLPGDQYAPYYVVKKRAIVSGEELTNAQQQFDPQSGNPVVQLTFNASGGRKFGEMTGRNIGKRFAIVLDDKVLSAPTIQSAITGGSGIITGNFTVQSANELSLLLRSGALPAPLNVEDQRTVTAELGADAVKAGSISLAIGAVSMFVFVILAYGLFGGFAAIALVVNVLLIVGIMSMTQATLTFPGIAGLILTLAVAVDANVLIYERMRDEANAGRTPMAAADHGYKLALTSILDANITSLISGLIMFSFGSGPVKGFAWTLVIGVFTSLFTAIFITQVLIGWWFKTAKPKKLPIA